MVTIENMKIPSRKYKIFVEILDKTHGRFIRNPLITKDIVIVSFTTNNYGNFQRAWEMVNREIVETTAPWYKTLLRRIRLFVLKR